MLRVRVSGCARRNRYGIYGDGRVSQSRCGKRRGVLLKQRSRTCLLRKYYSVIPSPIREKMATILTHYLLVLNALRKTQSSDPSSPSDSVGAILEIRDPIVLLVPAQFVINPPRRLILSAQIRLIRTADDTVLDDRIVTEEFGTTRSLAEWTADDAKVFREDVRLGAHRLAATISEQEFILQRAPERTFSMNIFYNGYFTGLAPVNPPMVASRIFDQVDLVPIVTSLQPTLRWEAFKGDAVTYDLMLWRAAGPNLGNLVYSRERLTKSYHIVEIPLDPKTRYFWAIRARFSANGKQKSQNGQVDQFPPAFFTTCARLVSEVSWVTRMIPRAGSTNSERSS